MDETTERIARYGGYDEEDAEVERDTQERKAALLP